MHYINKINHHCLLIHEMNALQTGEYLHLIASTHVKEHVALLINSNNSLLKFFLSINLLILIVHYIFKIIINNLYNFDSKKDLENTLNLYNLNCELYKLA